jgi:hypothetical protein
MSRCGTTAAPLPVHEQGGVCAKSLGDLQREQGPRVRQNDAVEDAVDTSGDWTLWYDRILIGHVVDPFYSDYTWWGTLVRTAQPHDGELVCRLLSFIDFCDDWNERTRKNPANPPSTAEFDLYDDILMSGLWLVQTSQGEQQKIDIAPLFHAGGVFCWRAKK